MINLPRQARDKHREKNSKKDDAFSCGQGEVYRPTFIYHGFRYVRLDNFPGTPEEARKVRKRLLCALPFIALKKHECICQDRLGTNAGKALEKETFCFRPGGGRTVYAFRRDATWKPHHLAEHERGADTGRGARGCGADTGL
jgi:hypothetical protein